MADNTSETHVNVEHLSDDVNIRALQKAADAACHDGRFSQAEIDALKQWAQVVIGLQAIGKIANLFKSGLVWIGIVAGCIMAFNGWFRERLIAWLGSGL